MKVTRLLSIAALCLMSHLAMAQTTQYGLVEEYHGKQPKTALPHVTVAATNAGVTQSGADGRFVLNFRTLHAGDAIQFRRVELSGYEVMNTEALEVQRVALWQGEGVPAVDDPAMVRIVMVPRAALQKLRDEYRTVTSRRYEQQLKLNEEELERLRREGKLAEEQYNARMNALEEEYEEKLSKLETYIDKFARIDLSDLDQDEQRIVELVQQGKFEEALQIYEDQHLQERLQQNRADVQQLMSMRTQLDEAARKKEQEIARLRQSIARQVTLLLMAGGEENYMKVHRIYRETFLADTTNWKARRDYCLSLRNRGEYDEMTRLLQAGIDLESDIFHRGMLMIDMALHYSILGMYKESMQCACRADSVMSPAMETVPQVQTRGLPSWSEFQLRYYLREGNFAACKPIVERLMQHWSPDSLSIESLYDYICVLTLMNEYYSGVGDHASTLWCARQTMLLCRLHEEKMPMEWIAIGGYASCCYTLMAEGHESEAWSVARHSAVLLADRIQRAGTMVLFKQAVGFYYPFAEALVAGQQFALADSIMQSEPAQKVFQRIDTICQEEVRFKVALYHYYEAQVCLAQGRIEESERLVQKWLDVIAAHEEGSGLEPYMRADFQARLYKARGRYKEAVKQCNAAVDYMKAAYAESQDAWDADNLCRSYLLLAEIHRASGNPAKAKKALESAKEYAVFPIHQKMIASFN